MSGLFDCDCACAAAPDYAPFANASKESAELMAKLGQDQLAETKRQYDLNRAVSDPVVKAQTDLMAQSIEQGNDYTKFMKEYGRPVDIALQQEAMASGGQTAQDAAAGRVRGGIEKQQAAEQAQQDRAMAGMGVNPNSGRFAGLTSARSIANAAATAGAMDAARESEKNLGFAKKLDVSGIFRGLPGASQGAYSVANQSGNSAVGNQMAPSGQMLAGQATAAGMIGQGQQQYVSGLGSIMGAQQQLNISNAQMSNRGGGAAAGIGQLAMGAGMLGWAPFAASDPRLKEHVVKVGESDRGFGIYEFSFKGDDTRWRGVMADEIEKLIPEAIQVDMDGYRHVNYTMLGIEMQRVHR